MRISYKIESRIKDEDACFAITHAVVQLGYKEVSNLDSELSSYGAQVIQHYT